MNNYLRAFFIAVLIISVYHFIRDILQTFGLDSAFTDIAHRPHVWCAPYCDVVTLPFDIIAIIATGIILKRNKVGKLGIVLVLLLIVFVAMTFLP